jgi:hypothetical protein
LYQAQHCQKRDGITFMARAIGSGYSSTDAEKKKKDDFDHRRPITLCREKVSRQFIQNRDVNSTQVNLTISNVQTLRTQTLTWPSTPSTSSRSIPSHQHRRAGFRQKRSSFWAMPTELLLDRSPRMSVRSFAKARLQMTALLGSGARWPHWSSRSKPLLNILVH